MSSRLYLTRLDDYDMIDIMIATQKDIDEHYYDLLIFSARHENYPITIKNIIEYQDDIVELCEDMIMRFTHTFQETS